MALGTSPRTPVEGWRHWCDHGRRCVNPVGVARGYSGQPPGQPRVGHFWDPGDSRGAAFRNTDHTRARGSFRSEEHTSELQSLMRISYAVFCLKKKNTTNKVYQTR